MKLLVQVGRLCKSAADSGVFCYFMPLRARVKNRNEEAGSFEVSVDSTPRVFRESAAAF